MFPMTWSNEKIMNGVSEVVTSNPWVQQTGRAGAMVTRSGQPVRFVTYGTYEGIKIRVINTHSEIITAFPIR
ncbi:EndoU domain-containing protein [Chitinophaga polysaccharea]|uniref:EndoU domain-containing protein n=1 Tax=Chitinophaga polysaccharea TaxID=1293035 RepID=UPI0011A5A8A4